MIGQWIEKNVRILEDRKRTVAKECDVDVVSQRYQPQGVAKQKGDVVREQTREEKLENVQHHQRRKEGVEVHIKGISPFDILRAAGGLEQILVADGPQSSGHKETHANAVNKYHPQEKLEEAQETDA